MIYSEMFSEKKYTFLHKMSVFLDVFEYVCAIKGPDNASINAKIVCQMDVV